MVRIKDFLTVLPTFELTGGNYITLTASISDTFGNTLSPVECSFVCFGVCNTCVKRSKVARFKMAARRVNMGYSAMETVEFVLNEGLDPEDFFWTVVLKRTLLILVRSLCQ